MRTITTLLLLLLATAALHAQSNFSGFNYQAVVRDTNGDPLPDQNVGVQLVLSCGSLQPYVEDHMVTTDANGLIELVIGEGSPVFGSAPFSTIDWSGCGTWTWNVTVSMDITGGTNYSLVGSQQMKAVPFALHALSSNDSGSPPQSLTLSNDTLYITEGNSVFLGDGDDDDWVQSGDTLHNAGKRVGIGTTAPQNTLHVVGGFRYEDGAQGNKKLLTSDALGNAHWESLSAETVFGSGLPQDPSCLNLSASIAAGDGTVSIAVAGGHAYVLNNTGNNMMVFDISDPTAPSLSATIATGAGPSSIAVSGGYAYVANYNADNMMVFDISDPAAPSLSSTIAAGTRPFALTVADGYAYVLNYNSNTMTVVDISDPATPSISATIATGSNPASVAVSGGYAYVANYTTDNMMVFDISDPTAPSLIATIATGTRPRFVTASGNHAYVTNWSSQDLMVFDISDPLAPSLSATIATGNSPWAMALAGSHACVSNNGSNNMMVFDINDPTSPSLSATIATAATPRSLAVSGNHAYVVTGSNEMQVFELFCHYAYTPVLDAATGTFSARPVHWERNGNDVISTNTGNVGIGTSTPSAKLDVEGTFKLSDGTEGEGKVLTSDANGLATWAAPSGAGWVLNGIDLTNTNSGRVGIGTTTPDAKLTIGTPGQTWTDYGLTTDARIGVVNGPGSRMTAIVRSSGTGGVFESFDYAANTTAFTLINPNGGNVGIGTNTPTSRLQVAAPYDHGTTLNLLQSTNSWGSPALFNAHRFIQTNFAGNPAEYKQFNVGGGGVSIGYPNVPIYGSSDALYVNGRVGIGTTSPTANLEVNGFTKLGSDAPAIKYKKITGNFPSGVPAYFTIQTGIDPAKILGVDMLVQAASGKWPPNSTYPGFTYEVVVSYSGLLQELVVESEPNATGLANAPYAVLITYEQ